MLMDTLDGVNYALNAESGIFCMWRYNPAAFGSLYGNAIAVYKIPGGYMLQLDPGHSFSPCEVAVE